MSNVIWPVYGYARLGSSVCQGVRNQFIPSSSDILYVTYIISLENIIFFKIASPIMAIFVTNSANHI